MEQRTGVSSLILMQIPAPKRIATMKVIMNVLLLNATVGKARPRPRVNWVMESQGLRTRIGVLITLRDLRPVWVNMLLVHVQACPPALLRRLQPPKERAYW